MKKFGVMFVVILLVFSFSYLLAGSEEISLRAYSQNSQIWFFHYGPKITWYIMDIWPGNFILTKIGPPGIKVNKNLSVTIAAGPDLATSGKKVFKSFTADVVPVINWGNLGGVFINEVGIDKDGKAIYFFRYSLCRKEWIRKTDVGVRLSGSGEFGQTNTNLYIGPMVRYHVNKTFSVEAWIGKEMHNGDLQMELVGNIRF